MGQEPPRRAQEALTVAALDLGSNTLKLTVAEVSPDGSLTVRFEDAVITRIGEGLDKNGRLLEAAMARTLGELSRLATLARAHGAKELRCVGTAGLRGASNAAAFLAKVEAETGIQVEIIDGLREAELAFAAPGRAFGPGPLVVVDLGGRSTEVVTGQGSRIQDRISLEIGSVRVTERLLPSDPPTDDQVAAARAFVLESLRMAPTAAPGAELVGVSGTLVALLGLQLGVYDAAELAVTGEGQRLLRASVAESFEVFRRLPAKERLRGTIIPEGRADVIVAGMLITLELFDRYQASSMRVSGRGVRYGLLYELAGSAGSFLGPTAQR